MKVEIERIASKKAGQTGRKNGAITSVIIAVLVGVLQQIFLKG